MIQNLFVTAQSTRIKSVISVPIKDCIHHYPRELFNDIPRVSAYFYDIPGSGRTLTIYPGRAQFNDIPGSSAGNDYMGSTRGSGTVSNTANVQGKSVMYCMRN